MSLVRGRAGAGRFTPTGGAVTSSTLDSFALLRQRVPELLSVKRFLRTSI